MNLNKIHSSKRSYTTPKLIGEMVECTGANIGYFIYQLDPDVRRLVKRLERLHSKILKRKQSALFN